jgi:UDP-N-acetylmuramoyl-L-alanyl-D-glutamate--2,6-diaminopimelate ligase
MKKLSELINNIEKINVDLINYDNEILGITDDSRELKSGFIFVAVKGSVSDGNKYIEKVISNGAICIITDQIDVYKLYKNETNIILVNNSRIALSQLLNKFYNYPADKFKIIGITGTNGKTTVSTLIYQALRKINKKVALIGTNGILINNEKIEATHTTPSVKDLIKLFLDFAKYEVEYIIMEVSSHSLDQYRVEFIDFDVAIFTNLSRDHLDYHLTMENYAKAKKMLFDGLSENSLAVINADDAWGEYMISECEASIKRISKIKKNNHFYLNILESSSNGNKFEIQNESNVIFIESKMLSDFNIMNLSFVAILLNHLGFGENITSLLADLKGPEGRMERIDLKNGAIAVVDYAHTPDALEKGLESLKQFTENKLICVFGCGGDRDKGKRPLMGKISNKLADFSFVTSDNPRTEVPEEIINDITIDMVNNYEVIIDRKEAIKKAILNSEKGDIILIAGKGHEKYQVIGKEKVFFDDFEEIKNANGLLNG